MTHRINHQPYSKSYTLAIVLTLYQHIFLSSLDETQNNASYHYNHRIFYQCAHNKVPTAFFELEENERHSKRCS